MCVDVRYTDCQPSIHLQICRFESYIQILNRSSIQYFYSTKRILKISLDQVIWKVIPYNKVICAKLLRKCRNTLSARIQFCRIRWINYKYSVKASFLAAEKLNYSPRFSTSTGPNRKAFSSLSRFSNSLKGTNGSCLEDSSVNCTLIAVATF